MNNRELKFRAWDNGAMVYEKEIQHILLEDNEVCRLARFWCNIRNDSKVMQYTGLKDKNGKEIYEGDICQRPSSNGTKEQMFIGVISFHKGSFCFNRANANIRMAADNLVYHYSYLEIIGNIYENPTLIEQKPTTK